MISQAKTFVCFKTLNILFLLCFITSGHFLLLTPSDDEKCEHQIISPALPRSNRQCVLQVALYESRPNVGNLTVLIKPLLSDLVVHSEVLNQRRSDLYR